MASEEVKVLAKEEGAGSASAHSSWQKFSSGIAGLIIIVAVAWAVDLPLHMGWPIWAEQFFALFYGLGLFLLFIHVRARSNDGKSAPPWYDLIAAFLCLGVFVYFSIVYPEISERIADRPMIAVVIGGIALVFVLEGLRRTCGLFLLIATIGFITYSVFGHHLSGSLAARYTLPEQLLIYVTWDTNGLLGLAISVISTVVVTFIFFGNLLRVSGGSEFFTDFADAAMGRYRGGSAKIAVTASALFGSVSGSAVANVASTGVMTIPLMKNGGYQAHKAGAIEAVASTGGQLMPPIMGAAAFLMAEFLQIPYSEVILAALVPALLYYVALFIQVDLEAARYKIRAAFEETKIPMLLILRNGWHYVGAFVVIIISLFVFNFSPSASAIFGSVSVVITGTLIGYRGKRLTLRAVWNACTDSGFMMLEIIMIGAAAGFIIGILNVTGFGFALTLMLSQLGAGNLFLMLMVAAGASIVLGLGMPTVGVYVLLALMVSPALIESGVDAVDGSHPTAS